MLSTFLLIVCVLLRVDSSTAAVIPDAEGREAVPHRLNQRYHLWTKTAMEYIRNVKCEGFYYAVHAQCELMLETPNNQMNVYVAESTSPDRKLIAVLPDSSLSRSGEHDVVLAIDPFPKASFGHFILLFFVDHIDQSNCELHGGIFLSSLGDCLRLALKNRCHNLLRTPRFNHRQSYARRCEVDFLPSVFEVSNSLNDSPSSPQSAQQLKCVETVPGFGACPKQRSLKDSSAELCKGPLWSTEDCEAELYSRLSFRCRLFEVCDHAMILFTGWNHLTSRSDDQATLVNTYKMLRNAHFPASNIKTFYANGILDDEDTQIPRLFPASAKSLLRFHLQQMCKSSHCVDSFVIFLHGPVMSNGKILLYDTNNNGMGEPDETYSFEELIGDLANCGSKQIILIADTSYSGQIVKLLRDSTQHRNLKVFSNGGPSDFSYQSEFTNHWIQQRHRDECVDSVFLASKKLNSEASMYDGNKGGLRSTLFGAPCDVIPPYTDQELKERFLGCQNVPTAEWFRNTDPRKRAESEASESEEVSQGTVLSTSESYVNSDVAVRSSEHINRTSKRKFCCDADEAIEQA